MELNGIKKVVQLDSCGGFLIILWAISRSTKAGRLPYKRGTGASFQPFILREYKKCTIMQAVRNIDFSYFINLTRNSSTLRPLDLDVQPMFYQFPSIIEHEHMPDRSMLVLLSCFRGRQQCHQFVFYLRTSKVHKISLFKEHTLVCPLWISQIWNPPCPWNSSSKNPPPSMPSEFQFKEPPMPSEFQKAVRRWVRIFSGIAHLNTTKK